MGYISTAMGHRFSALLMSLMALQVVLVDRNTKALFSSKATEILTKLYFYIQRRNTHCWWISQALNHDYCRNMKTSDSCTIILLNLKWCITVQYIFESMTFAHFFCVESFLHIVKWEYPVFLSASSSEDHTTRHHFFCFQTFMSCVIV